MRIPARRCSFSVSSRSTVRKLSPTGWLQVRVTACLWEPTCRRSAFASSFAGRPAPTEALARTGVQHRLLQQTFTSFRGSAPQIKSGAGSAREASGCIVRRQAGSHRSAGSHRRAIQAPADVHQLSWERAPDQVWGRLCARSFWLHCSPAGRLPQKRWLAPTGNTVVPGARYRMSVDTL
jgi:hypothetical protein